MNDKELADKVVALGVHPEETLPDDEFVRDWRVAGALMEKCQKIYAEYIGEPEQVVYARAADNRTWEWPSGKSLPRTIIEACVEALGPVLGRRTHE